MTIAVSNDIMYAVTMDRDNVIEPSAISLTIDPDLVAGRNTQVASVERRTLSEDLHPVVREKFAVIHDRCTLTLRCQGGYSVVFRAYDNGVAYRFQTALGKDIVVRDEKAEFHFAGPPRSIFPRSRASSRTTSGTTSRRHWIPCQPGGWRAYRSWWLWRTRRCW